MLLDKLKCLNASQLKYLAAFLMFLDHIHQMFVAQGAPSWLTYLGRLVFPIFLFLAADSFHYTKNRKAYLWRLLLGSWFMVLASNLIQSILPNPDIVLMNNAFSTFFVVGIVIVGWDKLTDSLREKKLGGTLFGLFILVLPIVLSIPTMLLLQVPLESASPIVTRMIITTTMMIPNIVLAEGGPLLVLLGLLFYIFRQQRLLQVAILLLFSVFVWFLSGQTGDPQWMMGFAALPMLIYNGQKGSESKWFFYIFYPTHIYMLYIFATLLF